MEINIIERKPNEVKIELLGEGDTLLNPLVKVLLKRENVEIATYHIPHPLNPRRAILYVKTKEGNPIKEIISALEDLEREVGKIEVQ